MQDVGVVTCHEDTTTSTDTLSKERCVGGCWIGLADDFSVVDANSSAVVGPRMVVRGPCGCKTSTIPVQIESCAFDTCLNGGKCLSSTSGTR